MSVLDDFVICLMSDIRRRKHYSKVLPFNSSYEPCRIFGVNGICSLIAFCLDVEIQLDGIFVAFENLVFSNCVYSTTIIFPRRFQLLNSWKHHLDQLCGEMLKSKAAINIDEILLQHIEHRFAFLGYWQLLFFGRVGLRMNERLYSFSLASENIGPPGFRAIFALQSLPVLDVIQPLERYPAIVRPASDPSLVSRMVK